jgi:hypothetical protein
MAKAPQADKGLICPLHKKDVSKVCHTCPFYTQIRGIDPNTGNPVDNWQCAIAWLPMLLIENSQQSRQAGAAVESMRNAIVERMDVPSPVIRMLER